MMKFVMSNSPKPKFMKIKGLLKLKALIYYSKLAESSAK